MHIYIYICIYCRFKNLETYYKDYKDIVNKFIFVF